MALTAFGPALGAHVEASPRDSRVGDVRVTYSKKGTVVRAEPTGAAAQVAVLPSWTNVTVEVVRLPWIRVSVAAAPGRDPVSGWVKAYETVEPWQLTPRPPPAPPRAGASGPDLARGYALVDEMESDTSRMDVRESLDFVMEGDLGRRGRDYLPPPRVPEGEMSGGEPAGGIPNVLAKVGDMPGMDGLFGGRTRDTEKVARAAKILAAISTLSREMSKKFSPGQEYYLGRAVAATALARFGVDPDTERRRYVKRIGDAIVRVTDGLPGTYGGYHFEVLDSDDLEGVAGPGGFVLVTRAAVEACATEDEVAALLCHELAHVRLQHGEKLLRRQEAFRASLEEWSRVIATTTGAEDPRVGDQILRVFRDSISGLGASAATHGYGSALEFEADADATAILLDALYDWTALRRFLSRVPPASATAEGGEKRPTPAERVAYLDRVMAPYGPYRPRPGSLEARAARFAAALRRPR